MQSVGDCFRHQFILFPLGQAIESNAFAGGIVLFRVLDE